MKFRQIVKHIGIDYLAIGEDGELYLVEPTDEYCVTATKLRVDLGERDPFEEEDPEDE